MGIQHSPQELALLNFWYEFDNMFMYDMPNKVEAAMEIVQPYKRLFPKYVVFRKDSNYPERFKSEFQGDLEAFRILAKEQLRLFHNHFGEDYRMEILAFSAFAQGILFDDLPRPLNMPQREGDESIHMMNSDIASYVVWHAFIMALILIDDKANKLRWLQIDKCVVLAAAILEKLRSLNRQPIRASVPGTNKPLDESTLNELENYWMQQNIGFEQIDHAIAEFAGI